MIPVVTLKPGHIQPVWSGHPWVFAQAIAHLEGGALPGDEVRVVDPHGGFLGRGLYTPRSSIPVRIVTRDDVPIDGALVRRRIERAIEARRDVGLPHRAPGHETTGYRLIHAEGDGLPGLIVDVFEDVLAVQIGTIGMKRREGLIFDALLHALSPRAIIDRTSQATAKMEGFEAASGVVRGDPNIAELAFHERGFSFSIPMSLGQKTGFYLDQRALRARVEQLAHGRRVLDTYAFVGTIAMAAARGGAAEVVAIDESALALEVGAEQARRNGLAERISMRRQDARRAPRRGLERGRLRSRRLRSSQARSDARLEGRRGRRLPRARVGRLPRHARRRRARPVLVLQRHDARRSHAGPRPRRPRRARAGDRVRSVLPGRGSPRAGRLPGGPLPQEPPRPHRAGVTRAEGPSRPRRRPGS